MLGDLPKNSRTLQSSMGPGLVQSGDTGPTEGRREVGVEGRASEPQAQGWVSDPSDVGGVTAS